jgi:hypothetical protein
MLAYNESMLLLNHALTGALLGLAIDQPVVLVPVAVASHFVLDSLPHFGYPELELSHRRWVVTGLIDGVLSVAAVIGLCLVAPQRAGHLVLGAAAAALPDLLYVPQVLLGRRFEGWWHRLHEGIQWGEHPAGIAVDGVWLVTMSSLLVTHLPR